MGHLYGEHATQAPQIDGERRSRAIESVHRLFGGFREQFGDTDCRALTGCDWSNEEEIKRYFEDKVYEKTCFKYLEYVLAQCLDQMICMNQSKETV